MKKIKSPLDIALESVLVSRNRARSRWSFGHKKFRDILESCGYTRKDIEYVYANEQLDRIVTYPEITDIFNGIETRIRTNYATFDPPEPLSDKQVEAWKDYFGIQAVHQEVNENTNLIKVADSPYIEEPDIDLSADKLYDPRPPGQLAKLHPKQIKAAREVVHKILVRKMTGIVVLAPTGVGKTYVAGSILCNLLANNILEKCYTPYPIIYVTKASIVQQTERVLVNEFGLDAIRYIKVINIEQLRAYFGTMFLTKEVVHEMGEPVEKWTWKRIMHPRVVIWDECHILKNESSEQSKIAQALNRVYEDYGEVVYQIFMSATPFMRVCEAKCFACSTGILVNYGLASNVRLVERYWTDFARSIAGSAVEPTDYSPAAIERLTDKFDDYIVRMKNVRPKFHARNGINIIDFQTVEERQYYEQAWNRFTAEKAKIEGLHTLSASQSRMMILAQFTQFRKAAEFCRANYLADFAVDTWNAGQVAGIATNFKGTITKAVMRLIKYHKWQREDISIIWGGSSETLSKKKKLMKKLVDSDEVMEALSAAGIDLAALGLNISDDELTRKTDEELLFEKEYNLLTQSPDQRQREIDRFQSGRSRVCFFTFKSGGVGLSLHHDKPTTRQRVGILTPTYSAIELVQGLGRLPRLTSLSDTPQNVVFYRGTIEEHVAEMVSKKLKCLGKVVKQREAWESVIIGQTPNIETREAVAMLEDSTDEVESGIYVEDEDNEENKS